jgi:predicted RNase H-like nuclease (RuvC/YqgF family)
MNKFNLSKFLVENKLTQLGRLSEEGYYEGEVSEEDMPQAPSHEETDANQVYEAEAEVEEDFSKYASVEELMKEIEISTNEAALKHKMERVKKAYESIEAKATALEEGEHSQYLAPGKIREMKRSCKELRKMHERLLKEYEKKYAVKKKSELNEEVEQPQPVTKNLQDLTWQDVVSVFPNIGKQTGGTIKFTSKVSFPVAQMATLIEVTSQKQFEEWKSKILSEFGDVEVTLDDSQKWHSKVVIANDEFNSKHDA